MKKSELKQLIKEEILKENQSKLIFDIVQYLTKNKDYYVEHNPNKKYVKIENENDNIILKY